MNPNYYVVIMAGGVGSRLWPYSRSHAPKQFQSFTEDGQTLLQNTADYYKNICPDENIYVVTNEQYRDLVKIQLPFLSDEQILLEPSRRNTAPCIGYACYKIASKNPLATVVVSPSDHLILDINGFQKLVKAALENAEKHPYLITFGIKPSRPDTGYGYIQFLDEGNGFLKQVKTFAEKPPLEIAKEFVKGGDYLWNSGIFVWGIQTIMRAFEKFQPEIAEAFEEIKADFYTPVEAQSLKKAYPQCKEISIDYAIMEKAENVYVIPADFGWSDLGTWGSVYNVSQKDDYQNVVSGDVQLYDTTNSIIKISKDSFMIVQGLDNFIIAEHNGVLIICQKEKEQYIKEWVADATKKGKA